VRQFITDAEGRREAALIDTEEPKRLQPVPDLISPSEKWLYENKAALKSVQRGLKRAAEGKVKKLHLKEL